MTGGLRTNLSILSDFEKVLSYPIQLLPHFASPTRKRVRRANARERDSKISLFSHIAPQHLESLDPIATVSPAVKSYSEVLLSSPTRKRERRAKVTEREARKRERRAKARERETVKISIFSHIAPQHPELLEPIATVCPAVKSYM